MNTKNDQIKNNLTPKDYAKMAQSAQISKAISKGHSVAKITRDLKIPRRTLYRRLNDQYCKNLIEQSIKTQIAAIPGTTKKLIKHCFSDNEKISLDAIKIVQENTGIRQSRTPNQFIFNIFNQSNTFNMLDPRLQRVFSGQNQGILSDPDIQEAEIANDE